MKDRSAGAFVPSVGNIAEAIAAGDRRYCELLEALPAAVYITDACGRITFYNHACVEFAGREPKLGDDCVAWRLYWPDGTPMPYDQCPMAIALREDRAVRGTEAVAERPDGSRIAFVPYPTPLHDQQGRLMGAINMLVDLTDRKSAEQAIQEANARLERGIADRTRALLDAFEKLRDGERRFRLLVDGVVDCAIFMLDPVGIVTSWNPGAERIKGYKAEDIIGQHFSVFYTPEDRAAGVPEHALGTAARYGRFESEGWRVRHDGSRFWASVVINALHDEAGELVGFAKVTRDFTERRKAEQALIESERIARDIVNTALDAFIQFDASGIVREWNPQATVSFGWTRDEAMGRHYADLIIPAADRDAHRDGVKALVGNSPGASAGRRLQFETEGRDGRQMTVEITVTGLRREDGVIYNAFARDLTDKLAAEAQLRQAQKMEAIGQLTGGIAHDFNNLLAAIVPNLELAKLRVGDTKVRKHLDDGLHAADRGAALTRRLLSFARKQELAMGNVDVGRLIAKACEVLPRTLGPAIRIVTRLAADGWPATTDASQLELALLNLAINARDAMPEGGILTLATANVPAGSEDKPARLGKVDCVEIDVIDTGCGMNQDVLRRVFEPFFTTKEIGKGSGLGLSMVYGFVEQSNGAIEIDSKPGQGTTVRLFLPRAVAAAAAERTGDAAEDGGPSSRVLLVDDDEAVRAVTANMIHFLKHEVVEAGSAVDALALLAGDRAFDLIVVDIGMPYMQGPAFVERARQFLPNVPVLFVTGFLNVTLPAGAQLLRKPYRQAELAAKLRSALGAGSADVLPFRGRSDQVA